MSEIVAAPEKADEKKGGADLLAEAKDRFKVQADNWSHNRDAALEDINFLNLDQWPEKIKKKRGDKPCMVADKLNQYVRQVVNDGCQNRPAVKVRPVDDKGDDEAANAFQGLIRDICNRSNADEAFDTALGHAAGSGFGYFRVITEYAHDKTFNQEIRVRRVRNPLAVLLGPHYLADGSDAEFGFVLDDIPKDRFKRQFPNAKETNWDDAAFNDGWSSDKNVRVCEYFYKVETREIFHLLADGQMVSDADYERAVEAGTVVAVKVLSREIPSFKVKWCRMTGAEILEERDWPGKYIPIIPVYGNETDIEGKVIYSGLIRAAKDPQMLYNFARSMFAERVAMTPRAPWMIAEGQIEGHEEAWKNPGAAAVLVYKNVDVNGTPLPPPQRISPSDIPSGFAEEMQTAEHDIRGATGMQKASLGEESNEKSGKAIMARQREGDTATFHYQDNLNRAIRYLGRILIDLIPKVYDSKRVVRMLGEDGVTATPAEIDPSLPVPSKKIGSKIIYNLGVGNYDVMLEAGPSYTTRRVEAAEAMIELVRANPAMWQTHGDLIVKAQDWPGADEFAKRSKLTLPPELRDEEGGDEDPDIKAARVAVQQIKQQAEEAIRARDDALAQAQTEIERLQAQLADKSGQTEAKLQDSDTKAYEARTERMQALEPAMTPEAIAAIVTQTVQAILAAPPQPAAAPLPADFIQ